MSISPHDHADDIQLVGVVGCGLMGSGIAEVCARTGLDVVVMEASPEAAEAGRDRVRSSLDHAVRRGKLTEEARDEADALLAFTTDPDELGDRQLVIEAVNEDEAAKIAT